MANTYNAVVRHDANQEDVGAVATWTESANSGANTAQALTHTGEAGVKHYLTAFEVAVKAAAVAGTGDISVVVRDGASGSGTIIWQTVIGASAARGTRVGNNFAQPLEGTAGNDLVIDVSAGGTGVVTVASMAGYSL